MKNKIVLFDIDYTIFDTDKFKESGLKSYGGYEEDEDALEKLSRIADLGIFSQGEDSFQRNKLNNTKLKRFFDDESIHIHVDKAQIIKEVLEKYKNRKIFLVDDKLDILAKVKTIDPGVFTVWIKRGIYAMNADLKVNFNPDKTISNLLDLLPMVSAF